MSKTVKGFNVRNQQRRRIRGDLSGDYEEFKWFMRSEGPGLFSWNIGKLAGYAGPELADALRAMKKAAIRQRRLQETFGEVDPEKLKVLDFLERWERRALQGRLEIVGPLGKGENSYYKVRVKDL